jgi:uncharacterized protein YhaN
MKNKEKIIMTKKAIVGLSLTQKFKKMYSSEIVPILKQKEKLDAKINELDAKINKLYAKRSELYAKINELYAKIFWKFVAFEKENDCKVVWKNYYYDFELKNLEVKSNTEVEEEKKVPEEITHDGHKYKLIS